MLRITQAKRSYCQELKPYIRELPKSILRGFLSAIPADSQMVGSNEDLKTIQANRMHARMQRAGKIPRHALLDLFFLH